MSNIITNTREINSIGNYVKEAFGATEFFIDDFAFYEAKDGFWLQVL